MKNLLLPFLALLFLISCEREPKNQISKDSSGTTKSSDKRDVCHNGNIINININAIPAHQAHGDAVDMDGDGYFDMENDCGMPVDCDDTDPNKNVSCGPTVISGYIAGLTKLGEARWRNFRTPTTPGWDVAVGAAAGTSGQFTSNDFGNLWNFAPDANHVTFTYDPLAGTLSTITVVSGGTTFNASYSSGNLGNVNYMHWQVNGDPGKILEFNNAELTVNGETYNLGDFQTEYADWYIIYDLSDGFTITGDLVINGQATSDEGMKLNISIREYTP